MFNKEKLKGLSSSEAERLLIENGPNVLPERKPPSDLSIFISQIKSPLVYVLIFAGLMTYFTGHTSDTLIILAAILINSLLGFFQERKASKTIHALKKMVAYKSEVVRDGRRITIDSSQIVIGDIVYLFAGVRVPADGELVETQKLFVDESLVTGESYPVGKKVGNKVFMGTNVYSGNGIMKVTATGALSQMGDIASSSQQIFEETPLRQQLVAFSKKLVLLITLLVGIVFLVSILRGFDFLEAFMVSIALAVSAVPEGLLICLTVILAIGMWRMAKRKGLVRRLVSAETLGGVTVVCLDKTGTLTEGKLEVVDFLGNKREIAYQMIVANDLDDPMLVSAYNWASRELEGVKNLAKRVDTLPFSTDSRFFACLVEDKNKRRTIYVNGAPEILIEGTSLEKNEKEKVKKKISDLILKGGFRALGLAKKKVSGSKVTIKNNDVRSNLEWVGTLFFSDPVRLGVAESLAKMEKANVKLLFITGDYPQTAISVLNSLGINLREDEIIIGDDLVKMSDNVLKSRIKSIKLFARTTPSLKLRIVNALKANGEVVAMIGDGVNDAPALNRADIGVVVGSATDVAKEIADLILLDSKFETIVAAIEEGRNIFNNLRRVIVYLMSTAFNEIIAVFGAFFLNFPLPVTAAQILWINLVSDGFPNLSLTVEPKGKDLMKAHPKEFSGDLFANWMKVLVLLVGFVSGVIALFLFGMALNSGMDLTTARSIAFVSLGSNSLIYVFSVRKLKDKFRFNDFLSNKWLVIAVFVGFFLQVLPFLSPSLRDFFKVSFFPVFYWFFILAGSLFMFLMIEFFKIFLRR
jgi:Ca2+-transporting ATPase